MLIPAISRLITATKHRGLYLPITQHQIVAYRAILWLDRLGALPQVSGVESTSQIT